MDIQDRSSFHVAIPSPLDCGVNNYFGDTASSRDHLLVTAAQSGCRIAFDELWSLYSRRVYKTIVRITNNAHDAEDALQDAFMRAFLAIESFEGRANFCTWLTRIGVNSALGILRRRRSRPETSLSPNPQREGEPQHTEFKDLAPNPEEIYAGREEIEKLMQAIQRLPPTLRKVTQARISENCSVKEVAFRLNISETAAKSRLRRARIMLVSLSAVHYDSKAQTAVI